MGTVKETIDNSWQYSLVADALSRDNTQNVSYCLFHGVHYPHQHSVDTPVSLPLRRCSYLVAGITLSYYWIELQSLAKPDFDNVFWQCENMACLRIPYLMFHGEKATPAKRKLTEMWTAT